MNLNFLLGTFSIVVLGSACSGPHGAEPGGERADNDTGVANGDSQGATGASKSDDGDATGGADADEPPTTTESASDSQAAAGTSSQGPGGAAGDENTAGSNSDGAGDGGLGGLAGTAGAPGLAGSASTGGVSGSGGSAGHAGSASAGGVSGGGSAGHAGSAGSGGASGSAGSGGSTSSSAGSGGSTSSSAGSGASTGGSAGGSSLDPEYLFTSEEFGGNGRTCVTCHSAETGTINPDQVQALYSADPADPLFRPIDSDDGASDDYTQLRERATFRVPIALPPGVSFTSDPGLTSVVFRRGAPTTINTPALDPVIMWDGRAAKLTDQALAAILGHAQATVTPTTTQLELIADFEQSDPFFSSDTLRQYSQGGAAPAWPAGSTASEQRGRRWFAEDSTAPHFNICGQCHGGPMTNTTAANSGLAVGQRFQTVNVSEFNTLGNPSYQFTFPNPRKPGETVTVTSPDPGRALITGDVRDLNFFKIPPLWGVKNTAPYFHDNSALTLEELVDHYEAHLATFLPRNGAFPFPHVPSAQDKADIIAYLKLL